MSRIDCISNRNIKIISSYVFSKVGSIKGLFDDLSYPTSIYRNAEDYFLNEEEWTTLPNFYTIFRRARDMVQEEDFCFKCGLSTAKLSSWGKLHYFAKLFSSPSEGFKRVGFFNKQFNDTKEIRVIIPPYYDKSKGLMRTIIVIEYHEDMDPNEDVMGDLYTRGILSSIPVLWNLPPAEIRCTMAPYDPMVLMEIHGLKEILRPFWRIGRLNLRETEEEETLGELVELIPEEYYMGTFLGKYGPPSLNSQIRKDKQLALLLFRQFKVDELTLEKDTLLMAPYFVLDITYERMSVGNRLRSMMPSRSRQESTQKALMETIEELKASVREKRLAYLELEKKNAELKRIQEEQERIIQERTGELEKAREELTLMNKRLQKEVKEKTEELRRTEFLKRYLSPSVTNFLIQKGQSDIPFIRKFVTMMFVDIRDFSVLSELNEPEDTVEILNTYFDKIIGLTYESQGTIYKILGDGIIIVFNDIIDIQDHAYKAVELAWKIREVVEQLNLNLHDEVRVGIGINSGYVSLGTIGSELFKDYAIVGKEMNLTARVQSVAGPGEIVITKRTLSLVGDRVEALEIGEIPLKGITRPVKLFKVVNVKN